MDLVQQLMLQLGGGEYGGGEGRRAERGREWREGGRGMEARRGKGRMRGGKQRGHAGPGIICN